MQVSLVSKNLNHLLRFNRDYGQRYLYTGWENRAVISQAGIRRKDGFHAPAIRCAVVFRANIVHSVTGFCRKGCHNPKVPKDMFAGLSEEGSETPIALNGFARRAAIAFAMLPNFLSVIENSIF